MKARISGVKFVFLMEFKRSESFERPLRGIQPSTYIVPFSFKSFIPWVLLKVVCPTLSPGLLGLIIAFFIHMSLRSMDSVTYIL